MMEVADGSARVCPYCNSPIPLPRDDIQHLQPGSGLQQGRFIIGRCLGRGGFGITYLAWDSVMRGPRAIKEYFPSKFASRIPPSPDVQLNSVKAAGAYQRGLRSFHNEAIHLEELRDVPGIVRIYSYFEENNTGYLVMEFLTGMTLSKFIKLNRSRLSLEESNQIMLKILYVVKGLHDKKIVIDGKPSTLLHRDISTDNIFISQTGQVTLLDFGSAREEMQQEHSELTNSTKAGYSAPEQINNWRQGTYTDVYAVGVCYFKLLTGHIPSMNTDGQLENIRDEMKNVPAWVDQIFHKATAFKVENRYKTADEFIRDLQSHMGKKKSKHTGMIVLGSLLGVLVVGIAGVLVVALLPHDGPGQDETDPPRIEGNITPVDEPTATEKVTETPTVTATATPTEKPKGTENVTDTPGPTESATPTERPTNTPTPKPTAVPDLISIDTNQEIVTYLGRSRTLQPAYMGGGEVTVLAFDYNKDVISVEQRPSGEIVITGVGVGNSPLIITDANGTPYKFANNIVVEPLVSGLSTDDVLLHFGETARVTIETNEGDAPYMQIEPKKIEGVQIEQVGNELLITATADVRETVTVTGGGATLQLSIHTPGELYNARLMTCVSEGLDDSSNWVSQALYTVDQDEGYTLILPENVEGRYLFFAIDNDGDQIDGIQGEGVGAPQLMENTVVLMIDLQDPALYTADGKPVRISDGKREINARIAIGEPVKNIEAFSVLSNGLHPSGATEDIPLDVWQGGDIRVVASSSDSAVAEATVDEDGVLHVTYGHAGTSTITLTCAATEQSWSVTVETAPVLQGTTAAKQMLYIGDTTTLTVSMLGGVVAAGDISHADNISVTATDIANVFEIKALAAGDASITVTDEFGHSASETFTVNTVISGLEQEHVALHDGQTATVRIGHADGYDAPVVTVDQAPDGVTVTQKDDVLEIRSSAFVSGDIVLSAEGKTYTVKVDCVDSIRGVTWQEPGAMSMFDRADVLASGRLAFRVETWSGSINQVRVDDQWKIESRQDGQITLVPALQPGETVGSRIGTQTIIFKLGDQEKSCEAEIRNGFITANENAVVLSSGRAWTIDMSTLSGTNDGIQVTVDDESIVTWKWDGTSIEVTGVNHGETKLTVSDPFGSVKISIKVNARLETISYNGTSYARTKPPVIEGINDDTYTLTMDVKGGTLAHVSVDLGDLKQSAKVNGNTITITNAPAGDHTINVDGVKIAVNLTRAWRLGKNENNAPDDIKAAQAALNALGYAGLPSETWNDDYLGAGIKAWRTKNSMEGANLPAAQQTLTREEYDRLIAEGAAARAANETNQGSQSQTQTASRPSGEAIVARQMALGPDGMVYVLDEEGYLNRIDPSSGTVTYSCLGSSKRKFQEMYAAGDYLLLRDTKNWYQIGTGNFFSDGKKSPYEDAPWLISINPSYEIDMAVASESTIAVRMAEDITEEKLQVGMLVYWDASRGSDEYTALHLKKPSLANQGQGSKITAMALSGDLLVYTTADGQVFCLGSNNGLITALGARDAAKNVQNVNVRVNNATVKPQVTSIAMDNRNLVLLLADGTALVGGNNDAGQFGAAEMRNSDTFATVTVNGAPLTGIVSAQVSNGTVYLLTSTGSLYAQTGGKATSIATGVTQLDCQDGAVYAIQNNRTLLRLNGTQVTTVIENMKTP